MIILGIDPGIATAGYGVLQKTNRELKLLDYGCITTAKNTPDATRLHQIASDIAALIKQWKPDEAIIEKIYSQKNIKTVIQVAQARGVIIQKLTENNIPVTEITPLEIKRDVCGYGKADKKMIQTMVKKILGLKITPKPDDAADAVAAAICLAQRAVFR